MDIYVLDNELTRVRTVATSSECLSATEELELGKAGQLTLSLPISYKDTVKEMNILAIHDRDDRYRLYIVTNRNLNNYTLDIVGISYPNYALSRVGNVKDLRPNNRPLTELIPQVLGNSGWTLNYVDENLPGYTGSFYYLSRLECLSQISEALACEFDFYVTIAKNVITGQFVDVVEMLGEDTNRRFEYGTNALEVVAEYDATEVYTQAVGRGKGEETGDGYGRRIEFTDVVWSKANGDPVDKPAGQNWVNDPYENYQLPGNKRPQKIIEFEEITDPNVLLEETYKWLLDNNHPKVQFKAKIVETGALNLGDRVQIIRPDLDIRYKTRVFKLTRNLLNENLTEVEFGDNIATTPMDKLNSITTQVNSTNQALQRVEEQITMIDADGNRITYGPDEPSVKKKGDMWYKTTPDGKTELYIWNGETWELTIGDAIFDELEQKVNDAMSEADEAKKQADTARNEASSALTKADTALTDALNASQQASNAMSEITSFKDETGKQIASINGSIDGINVNVSNLDQREQSNFTLLSGQLSSVLTNGINMFPNSIFKDAKLSSYFMSPIGMQYFEVIKKRDSDGGTNWGDDNCLKITTNISSNTNSYKDCTLRMLDMMPAKGGDTFSISFDYLKPQQGPQIGVWVRFRNQSAQDKWLTVFSPKEPANKWTTFKGELTAPTDTAFIQIMVGVRAIDGGADGDVSYLDNVLVTSTEVTRNQFVQTTNSTLSKIENLEQKTDTKFLQTDELLAMQAQKIGAYYPNGDFSDTSFNKWYEGNGQITSNHELRLLTDGKYKSSAFLSDFIPVEGDKAMYLNFEGMFSSYTVVNNCKVYVHEYDANKTETRNAYDNMFKNGEPEQRWNKVSKTWYFQTNPKYIKIEWVLFDGSGYGELLVRNVSLTNGTNNLVGQISVMNDNINLSVKKGDVINQINVSTEGILIDGQKIHITGATSIDNAVIQDAMIANLSASKLTAGTIDAKKIKVINMDVNSLTGNKAQFIQGAFKAANSTSYIDGYGIRTKKDGGNSTALNTGRLEMRDKGDNLVYSLGGADWLDPNGYDDTALMKILGRRQFTIGFATDEDEYTVTPMVSFKQREDRNWMYIERDNFRIVSRDGYRLRPGSSMNYENNKIYPSLTNDNESVGILLGDSDLIFRDGYRDNAGSNQMSLNRIRSGQLDSLKTPSGGFTWTIKDGTINGNASLVLSGSATSNSNFIGMNNADIWLNASQSVYITDRSGSRYKLEDLRWGRMGQLEDRISDSKSYKLCYVYSSTMGDKNNPCLKLGGSNVTDSSLSDADKNFIAMNNADIWIKAKYNIIFSDGYGGGMTFNAIRDKLTRSTYALETRNGAIELMSETINGQDAKVLTDETGSGIAFVDGKLMFKDSSLPTTYDSESKGWLALSDIINEIKGA